MTTNIKQSAQYEDFVLEQAESGSITVRYSNTSKGLDKIAEEVGFELKEGWNTQAKGRNLINFLNDEQPKAVASDAAEPESEQDERTTYISDQDWEWWLGLSDTMKYVLLWSVKDFMLNNGDVPPSADRNSDYPVFEWDPNDRNGRVSFYLSECYFGVYNKKGELIEDPEEFDIDISFPRNAYDLDDLSKLSYLRCIQSLNFSQYNCCSVPEGLSGLNNVVYIDLSNNYLSDESLAPLHSLTELGELNLYNTGIEEDDEEFQALVEALPNCAITLDGWD